MSSTRQRFARRRARAFLASTIVLGTLALVGWFFVEPHGFGAVRLFGVGLAWWAALGACALEVGAVAALLGDLPAPDRSTR